MSEMYCDICDNALHDVGGYKIVEMLRGEYDDEFVRICRECDKEGNHAG